MSLSACSVVDNAPPPEATPTPRPEVVGFSNENYVSALRAASLRLRGRLPELGDVEAVLASGSPAYEARIDSYLDPLANPFLATEMREFYQSVYVMAATDPDPINYNEPANLATYLFLNGMPYREMLSADYCVNDQFQVDACNGNVPVEMRAGFLTSLAFLKMYGSAGKLNFRRTSVAHQVFSCGVYPDTEDPAPWGRTNIPSEEWLCNPGLDGVAQSGTGQPCLGDDYADPSLSPGASDAAEPPRVSKKFQGFQTGLGMPCQGCHGSILARRGVFTPFAETGMWDPTRTLEDVETLELNGGGDFCGTATPLDPGDDMDSFAAGCDGRAEYHGVPVANIREFGQLVLSSDRFAECATLRHYNFALGKSQGYLGIGAGEGIAPPGMRPSSQARFVTLFAAKDWDTREFLGVVFRSPEYISTQAYRTAGTEGTP